MGDLDSSPRLYPLCDSIQVLPYEPIPCKQCGAVLNPYAAVDFHSKVWSCPLCHSRNHFPPHYQGINENNMPAELYASYSTIEYTLPRTVQPHPPVYLFLIDTCVSEDELSAAKAAVMQAISTLPEYVHVGLITFGRHVHVYELGFTECSKAYVFRGSKEYTIQQIVDQLGSRAAGNQRPGTNPAGGPRPPPGGGRLGALCALFTHFNIYIYTQIK